MWRLFALVILALSPLRAAYAETFQIEPKEEGTLVKFRSEAPIESFEGKTKEVKGHITVDLSDLSDSADVYVEVPLATLDTGIGLRNKHMRENHLETEKYPDAVFEGSRVVDPPSGGLEPDSTYRFEMQGDFSLHGVTREITVPIEATYSRGDGTEILRIETEFDVRLADYDISRPSFLFMQLDEVQHVTVNLVAKSARKGEEGSQ